MAVIKPWSLADKKKQWLIPQFKAPTTPNGTQVVSWWAMGTANALAWLQSPSLWNTQNNNQATPKPQVVQQANKPRSYGTNASQIQSNNPNYLDVRNTQLAKDFWWLNLKSQQDVYNQLTGNMDFAGASDQDKQNTAKNIWEKMQANITVGQQVGTEQPAPPTQITDQYKDNPRLSTLSDEEKQAYGMMSAQEQKTFIDTGRNDLKSALDYLRKWKEDHAYKKQIGESGLKQLKIQDEMQDIQWSQRIRQAEDQLQKLKSNVAYLGTMWAPWVSAVKLDAVNKQITEAGQLVAEIKRLEDLSNTLRDMWYADQSARLGREMQLLQDDLDDKVSKNIQQAFAEMSAMELKGWLDTVEWIDNFRKHLITKLDNSISGITDDNIKARMFLLERFDKIAQDMRDTVEKENTVNVDMSTAQWYYVNGNGRPIISMTTWQPIRVPQKPPMDPIFSKETGDLITFTTGANWQIVANVQKVTSGVQQGKIETIYTTDERGNEVKTSVMVMPDGSIRELSPWQWPSTTPWQQPIITTPIPPVSDTNVINTAIAQVQAVPNGAKWWQCGSFVNDYLERMWLGRLFVDPIEQKAWIANSQTPTVWSVAIMDSPTFPQYWHVAVVTKVNADWSFEVKESNRASADTVGTRVVKPWEAKYGFFDPRLGKQPQQNTQEMMMKAMWLLQGTGGTEAERQQMAQNIVKVAIQNNISLAESKKQLWYRTKADQDFIEQRKTTYNTLKKWDEAISNANRLLTVLEMPQTPISDIASVVWFLKSIDPSSVARESETEQIRKARSIRADIWMIYEKVSSWESLSKKQREQLKQSANAIIEMGNKKLNTDIWWMVKEFDERWLDASSIILTTDIEKYAPFSTAWLKGKSITTWQQPIAPMTKMQPTTWQNTQYSTQTWRLNSSLKPWTWRK